ncbi:uncharacterized protein LOC134709442 [Mytilus trossulus]|uniref:uncharacterized protein LOC134709442 n=1 Tax=Mytilus trossulus TaxID=6551 RepID=UPI00300490CE
MQHLRASFTNQMSRFLILFMVWSVNVVAQKYPKYLGSVGGSPMYEPYQPNQQIALPSNGVTGSRGRGPSGMLTRSGMATEIWPTSSGNRNQVINPLQRGNVNNNVENLFQNSGISAGYPNAGSNYPLDVINTAGVSGGSFSTGGMHRQSAQTNGKSAGIGSGVGGISVDPNIPYEQVPYNNGVLYDIYRQYTGPVDHYVNVAPKIYDPSTMSTAINAPNYLPPNMATEPVSGQRPVSPWDQFATDIGLGQRVDLAFGNGKTPLQGKNANPIGNERIIERIHIGEQPMVNAGQGIINDRGYPGPNGQMIGFIPDNGGPRNIEPFNHGNIDAIVQSHFPENGVQNALLVIPINLDQLLEQNPESGNLMGCQGQNCRNSPGLSLPLLAGSPIGQGSDSFIELVDQLRDPRSTNPVLDPGFVPAVATELITDPLYPHITTQITESIGYKTKSKYSKPTYITRPYSKPKQKYVPYRKTYERPIAYNKPMYRSKHNMYKNPQAKYGKHKMFHKSYNKPTKYTNTVNYGKSNYQKLKTRSEPRKYRAKSSFSKRRSYKKINKKGGY